MLINSGSFFTNIKDLYRPQIINMPDRRYDLDWLRVLAFGLLILFHTGMFYVADWGFHAKSNYQSQFLANIMLFIEPWRMALLWLISGISIRFILAKVSIWRFISMRTFRLLLPLLFGILVVVPPQLYIEMAFNSDLNMSYWQFLQAFFSNDSGIFENYQAGIWPHIDVNHLWFIRSLWQYSLLIVLLLPLLNAQWLNKCTLWLFKQNSVIAILLATLPIFIIQISADMEYSRYPLGFAFMIYGYLIGWQPEFWSRVNVRIKPLLVTMIIAYCSFIMFYNVFWLEVIKGKEVNELALLLGMFNYSLLRVLGILMAITLAAKFLQKKSRKLNYLNEAVYPFYILHQTIILVAGYNLSLLELGAIVEPILLIILTITGCFLGFEIIRRISFLRPCFGLKANKEYSKQFLKQSYIAAAVLVMPIGWEILF